MRIRERESFLLHDFTKIIKEEVDAEDIADVVSRWTGIPVSKMLITNEKTITYHIQACYVQLYLVVCVSRGKCADHFLCEESDDTPDDTSD